MVDYQLNQIIDIDKHLQKITLGNNPTEAIKWDLFCSLRKNFISNIKINLKIDQDIKI